MKMPGCHENINFHTKKGNQKKIRGCYLQPYEVTWLCSWICNVLLYPGTYYLTSLNFSFMFLKHVVIVQLLTHVCLCGPMNCNMPGFPVFHYLLEFQVHVLELVMPSNHLILCHPLLLLPSIFPSVRVFSNELALHIRWPNYWRFSVSIRPSNEYLGLISFRIDWLDLLAVQGTLKSLLHHHSWKASVL